MRSWFEGDQKKHEKLVWDSRKQGTYRKDTQMGIDGIEGLAHDPAEEHRVETPETASEVPAPEPTPEHDVETPAPEPASEPTPEPTPEVETVSEPEPEPTPAPDTAPPAEPVSEPASAEPGHTSNVHIHTP